ncbi:ribosomal subunit interface protein [Candidatus Kaiserbacteria bacterium CG10_big_fil_rev_8_21_14_0_10_49_17]|uniref:Ribosomal subunit interface protein n=1 Tax=Candidatus Kaiserbacteria bacterium CG10_big_fil_rev_8_21_14_0_10_49_17 TaxID=1974609 RepID=A0A2M6WE41_9BACT|nr:MAG: ribosomal subunit interface protein [Candidatus Kaiserbacteria bacterium CG10_big_fil_rev_8_21_14_0_10_49_17]
MLVSIKATLIELTPEIEEYINKKVGTFEKHIHKDDESVKCEVEVGKVSEHHQSGDVYRTEVNITHDGKLFRAESKGESMNAALDSVRDEMEKQLRRHKKKKDSLLRRGGARVKGMLKFGRQ